MTIIISAGDPRDPRATALLQASHALMQSLFEVDECHFLSVDDLCTPQIQFFVATDGDNMLGCGALANKGEYGEVKSMFVSPNARGKGIASLLLDRIDQAARDLGLNHIMLETGDTLKAAHRLYFRHGYQIRDAFGDYVAADASVFMEKTLE